MKNIILISMMLFVGTLMMAQSQSEMNKEAQTNYELSNNELNQVYYNILKEYKSDTTFIKNLKKSQRLWIQFRDAEMTVKYPDRPVGSYGDVLPMCKSLYKEGLTKDRIKTLMNWLVGFEEGDVCSGSLKFKVE